MLILDVVLFEHRLVGQLKLLVMDLIKRLLRGFSLPRLGQELGNLILHCLIFHLTLPVELLLECLLVASKLHLGWLISFLEGRRHIHVICVWVLPELAGDAFAPTTPVRQQVLDEELLGNLEPEVLVATALELIDHDSIRLVFGPLMDFFDVVNEAFQLLLSQLLLLDHLRLLGVLPRDFASILLNLLVDVLEELAIAFHELVVIVSEVVVQSVRVDVRHVLDVVRRPGHLLHRLQLQIHLNGGHGLDVLFSRVNLQSRHCFGYCCLRIECLAG